MNGRGHRSLGPSLLLVGCQSVQPVAPCSVQYVRGRTLGHVIPTEKNTSQHRKVTHVAIRHSLLEVDCLLTKIDLIMYALHMHMTIPHMVGKRNHFPLSEIGFWASCP